MLDETLGDKAKKRLNKARQMVDKNGFTMTWVVKDDVIDMVEAESVTTLRHLPSDVAKAEVERRAQRIWDNPVHKVCFPLDIYRTAQGKEGT